MKQYRSHKLVEAAKIERVTWTATTVILDLEGGEQAELTADWAIRHSPNKSAPALKGGYFVRYPLQPGEREPYTSWSPAEAFEAGNTLVEEDDDQSAVVGAIKEVSRSIEPCVYSLLAALPPGAGREAPLYHASVAISARRIADALTIIATAVDMVGSGPHALDVLMENAGQAFALGMRGR